MVSAQVLEEMMLMLELTDGQHGEQEGARDDTRDHLSSCRRALDEEHRSLCASLIASANPAICLRLAVLSPPVLPAVPSAIDLLC
jgi:hypothetical protein